MKMLAMCLNWKVVVGLAVVALGVWVLAPNLLLAAIPLLIVAACPLSMLIMMRGMSAMNAMQDGRRPQPVGDQSNALFAQGQPLLAGGLTREERLTQLRAELAEIQARLAALTREDAMQEAGDDERLGPIAQNALTAERGAL